MSGVVGGVRERLSSTHLRVRRVVPWLLLGACVPSAVRLAGDRDLPVTVMLVAWVPVAAVVVALLSGLALLLGRRGWAGLGALTVALNAAWLAPMYIADDPPVGGTRIVAMTVNLFYGQADPRAVVEQVRRSDVDVLVLTELTLQAVAALSASGLDQLLPHRVIDPAERAHGSGVWSRRALTPGPAWTPAVHRMPGASLRIGGQEVIVRAAHPFRTSRFNTRAYRADYRMLTERMRALDRETPALVLGDFNATRDHSAFRRMLGERWRDAAEYAGSGFSPTWNFWPRLPAAIALDHVLISEQFGAVRTATFHVPGSDHDGVRAELVLAER